MKISLNGDPKELSAAVTLQQLLDDLGIPSGRVACEVNLKIIKRAVYPDTLLQEGDTVEIIQAIGGG
jgi:sulfur carrier protein